jgi:hypothetical protein
VSREFKILVPLVNYRIFEREKNPRICLETISKYCLHEGTSLEKKSGDDFFYLQFPDFSPFPNANILEHCKPDQGHTYFRKLRPWQT